MQIDDKMLEKLEKLSALKIPDEKREEFKDQLSKTVDFVDILNELNLDGIEAAVSTANGGTPLRDDEPRKSDVIDIILQNAPQKQGKSFEVPKIIE